MQSGLIETPNRELQTSNSPLSQPSTSQYGPSRSRSSLPDAHFPLRARSTSSDAQRSTGGLVDGQFDQQPGRLNVAEDKPAAGSRLVTAGQRIADYENAATHALPRQNSRPALGFKVINSSPSDGVQLTDFPNGSFSGYGCRSVLLQWTADMNHCRDPNPNPVPPASRHPRRRSPGLEAFLRPRHDPVCMAGCIFALLRWARRPGHLEEVQPAGWRGRVLGYHTVRSPLFRAPDGPGILA